jgi:hypothetical protein
MVVITLLVGCQSPASSRPPAPSSAASAVTAGPQSRSGFVPCRDIDDEQVRAAGFNPATREPQLATGEYTAACEFTSSEMSLIVSTSTTLFETFRDRYAGKREGLNIGKRPAVIVRKTEAGLPCELAMKTDHGIVSLQTTLNVAAKQWGMDRCARIAAIATIIEPSISSG